MIFSGRFFPNLELAVRSFLCLEKRRHPVDKMTNNMEGNCCSTQLIDENGVYNVFGMVKFMKNVKLGECGLSYVVVSIMGPQCSGKSTLLNHLFKTNFREMDVFEGRSRTTQGIWLAGCVDIEPFTIVLDLEGSDGRERQQDCTAFEKRIALFALAVSDIVLINIWYHNIGRELGAIGPLLKNAFHDMMRFFCPRKTTLLFVIRDKTKTPLENLKRILREDIQKIWDSADKPHEHKDTPLSELFNVEVVALSSFKEEEQFKEQVASLRERFFHSIAPGGLAGDRHSVVPASRFSFNAWQIWKAIEYTYFDPYYMVMVYFSFNCECLYNFDNCISSGSSYGRLWLPVQGCDRIVNAKIASFTNNKEWRDIEEAVQNGIVIDFGKKLNSILDNCTTSFDMETKCFDDIIRTSKRQQLEWELLELVKPTHCSLLAHLRSRTFEDFKWAFEKALERGDDFAVAVHDCSQSSMFKFDEECEDAAIKLANWDSSKVRKKILGDIEAHVASVRTTKISELTSLHGEKLNKALLEPMEVLLDSATGDTRGVIRRPHQWNTKTAALDFSSALSSLYIDEKAKKKVLAKLD